MTKTQVEVITSVQRRRSWLRAGKERIVAAYPRPDALTGIIFNLDLRSATLSSGRTLWRHGTWPSALNKIERRLLEVCDLLHGASGDRGNGFIRPLLKPGADAGRKRDYSPLQ
jgi:hypothetical protein